LIVIVHKNVPPKRWSTFNGLHGVETQRTVVFITTAVRTSNPTEKQVVLMKLVEWFSYEGRKQKIREKKVKIYL
jgi:hypothetical protein